MKAAKLIPFSVRQIFVHDLEHLTGLTLNAIAGRLRTSSLLQFKNGVVQ